MRLIHGRIQTRTDLVSMLETIQFVLMITAIHPLESNMLAFSFAQTPKAFGTGRQPSLAKQRARRPHNDV
jgi:hypothetical protein